MASRHLEGRSEAIIDPTLPIIDAHHHLFVRPKINYLVEEYSADVNAGHNIVASVYVEAVAAYRTCGPEMSKPLGEIEFANWTAALCATGTYGPCQIASSIVGFFDMREGDKIAEVLDEAHLIAPWRFRGIRQLTMDPPTDAPYRFMTHRPPRGVLEHPNFRVGFKHLAPRGLSFDAGVFHHQLPEICRLADDFPDTTIILNHAGILLALDMNSEERKRAFLEWKNLLGQLARRQNVLCKIGGFGLPYWGFDFQSKSGPVGYMDLASAWRPYIETAIELFGTDRCMMESNYPADAGTCGFVPLWNALKYVTRDYSPSERANLFHDTAARAYRIEL